MKFICVISRLCNLFYVPHSDYGRTPLQVLVSVPSWTVTGAGTLSSASNSLYSVQSSITKKMTLRLRTLIKKGDERWWGTTGAGTAVQTGRLWSCSGGRRNFLDSTAPSQSSEYVCSGLLVLTGSDLHHIHCCPQSGPEKQQSRKHSFIKKQLWEKHSVKSSGCSAGSFCALFCHHVNFLICNYSTKITAHTHRQHESCWLKWLKQHWHRKEKRKTFSPLQKCYIFWDTNKTLVCDSSLHLLHTDLRFTPQLCTWWSMNSQQIMKNKSPLDLVTFQFSQCIESVKWVFSLLRPATVSLEEGSSESSFSGSRYVGNRNSTLRLNQATGWQWGLVATESASRQSH